jgi:RNA polymerase sigma factor (sigma-70 family)
VSPSPGPGPGKPHARTPGGSFPGGVRIASLPLAGRALPRIEEADTAGSGLEAQLAEGMRQGDVDAFVRIIDTYWHGTLQYARQLADDPDIADDVTQEAFARLWQRRTQWTVTGSMRGWLLRTVRNLIISEQRKRRVRSKWATRARAEQRPTPLQEVEAHEASDVISNAVMTLSPRRREAFTLFHLHGLSHREVAEIMEVRPQTVANYLHAAVVDLRTELAPYFRTLPELARDGSRNA